MKCLICGGDSAGEVCNKCSRLEKILYQKEWSYREGLLLKKTEGLRVAISNMRLSGRVAICDNPKGLNARLDNISHYLLNVRECSQINYQGKMTVMVVIENNTGENLKYTRYCLLPAFEEADQFMVAISEGKQKATTLTEKIRQTNGMASTAPVAPTPAPTPAPAPATPVAPAPAPAPAAPTPAPAPAPAPATPASFDTVALSSVATDINEFETKIKKLKVLRDNGILSEEEYLAEKKKLVSIF